MLSRSRRGVAASGIPPCRLRGTLPSCGQAFPPKGITCLWRPTKNGEIRKLRSSRCKPATSKPPLYPEPNSRLAGFDLGYRGGFEVAGLHLELRNF